MAVAFLLGAGIAQSHPLPLAYCAVPLAVATVTCFALRRRSNAVVALLLLAGFLAGMARATLALDAIETTGTRYSVEMVGRVDSEPYSNPDTGRLIFRFQLESIDDADSNLSLRLYLRDDEPPIESVRCGQRLKLKGHIWRADPVTNPYEFDFGAYLKRQGFSAYATAKLEDVEILDEHRDLQTTICSARREIASRIDALFTYNAPIMRALVLGDRSQLSDELRQSFNRTGTAHMLSISGLHVTLLAALLAFLLGHFMPRRRADLAAIAMLLPYGALIGFGTAFVRALAMFAILRFAPLAGRPSDPVTRLSAALVICLLVWPLFLNDAGFALSFSASAGIILLLSPLSSLFGLEARDPGIRQASCLRRAATWLWRYVRSLLCVSLAAQLATLPSVIAFFGVQSIVSLPFNLICVPLCLGGYIAGLAALLISAVCMPLAALMARAPDALFSLLTALTRSSALIPFASVRLGRYPAALVLLHWGIMLAASTLSRIRLSARRLLPFTLLAVAALASALVFARAWDFSLVFLDAGQADCAVVRTRGHTYMVDVGDTYTPAADYLNATCLHLDGIVLSHPHQDHAGGLSSVLASFRPDVIYVPEGWFDVEEVAPAVTEGIELAQNMGVEIRELSAGDRVRLSGTAEMQVYSPMPGAPVGDVNDMSLLTLIDCDGHTALFTGDLSSQAEPEVIPDTEVLKVAHHGSGKGTSERFVSACSPQIAVISVGENNYGHPSEETLAKLSDSGASILLTRELGAITATLSGGEWKIRTYLEAQHELE